MKETIIEKSHYRASIVRDRRLSYKMCAFAPRHAPSAANRHKGGLGSPPKMLHESSSTKSWQFMAVNHSVYLVLGWAMLCYMAILLWLCARVFSKRERSRDHGLIFHHTMVRIKSSYKVSSSVFFKSSKSYGIIITLARLQQTAGCKPC